MNFDYGVYPEYNFGSFSSNFDGRQGSSREEMELDEKALDLMKKIRECKPYLRARLKQIEDQNQHLLLADDVENIQFWLALAQEVRADCVYGVDTLEIAYQDIIDMARKYPVDEVVSEALDPSDEDEMVSAADPRLRKNKTNNGNHPGPGFVPADLPSSPVAPGLVPNPLRSPSQPREQEPEAEAGGNSGIHWNTDFPERPSRPYGADTSSDITTSRVPMVGRGRGRNVRIPEPVVGNIYSGQPGNQNVHPLPDQSFNRFSPVQSHGPARDLIRSEIPREHIRTDSMDASFTRNFDTFNGNSVPHTFPNAYRRPTSHSVDPKETYHSADRVAHGFQFQRESLDFQPTDGPVGFFEDAFDPVVPRGHVPRTHFNPPPPRALSHGNGGPRYISPGGISETGNFRPSNQSSFVTPNPIPSHVQHFANAPRPSYNPLPSMYMPHVSASQRSSPSITPEMIRQKAQNHFGPRPTGSRPRFQRYFNNNKHQRQPPRNRHNGNTSVHSRQIPVAEKPREKNYSDAPDDQIQAPGETPENNSNAPDDQIQAPGETPEYNSNIPDGQSILEPGSRDVSVPECSGTTIADHVPAQRVTEPPPSDSTVVPRKVADNKKARLSKLNHKEMLERVKSCVRKKTQQASNTPNISVKDLKKSMVKPGFYKLGTKSKNTFEEAPEPSEPDPMEVSAQSSIDDPQEMSLKKIVTPRKPKNQKTKAKTPTPQKPEDSGSSNSEGLQQATPRKKPSTNRSTPAKVSNDVSRRPTAARKTPNKDQIKIKFPFQKQVSPRSGTKRRAIIESSSESDENEEPAASIKTPPPSSDSDDGSSSSDDDETIYLRNILKQMHVSSDDIERLLSNHSQKTDVLDFIKSSLQEAGRPAQSPEKEVVSSVQLENPRTAKVLKSLAIDSEEVADVQDDSRLNRKRKQKSTSTAQDRPDIVASEVLHEPPLVVQASPVKKRGRPNEPEKSTQYSIPESMFKQSKTTKIQPALIPVHLGLTKIKIEADYFASNIKIEPQSYDD